VQRRLQVVQSGFRVMKSLRDSFKSLIFQHASGILILISSVVLILAAAIPSDKQLSFQRNNLESSIANLFNGHKKIVSNPEELVFKQFKKSNSPKIDRDLPKVDFPYVHPVMAPRKSSGFGPRIHPIRGYSSKHKGLDLAAPVGVNIRAMAAGKVIFADPYAGYGNLVVVDHGKEITTHYAHCDRLKVHPGDIITAGQIIAEVGSTGASTGPHLHLEVRIKGEAVNPENFFKGLFDKAAG
jgi:murein DD-endopeptidase MepM/ murein hydrolase activator NlpD